MSELEERVDRFFSLRWGTIEGFWMMHGWQLGLRPGDPDYYDVQFLAHIAYELAWPRKDLSYLDEEAA